MNSKKRARQLIEEPGFYLGPFQPEEHCAEDNCQERAFSATDDNRVRCFEHTLSYLQECAAKATRTPKKAFDALRDELKRLHSENETNVSMGPPSTRKNVARKKP